MSQTDPIAPPRPELPEASPEVLDAVWAELSARTVDRDPSLRDRLRELPTPTRVSLALTAAVLGCVAWVLLVVGLRTDLMGEALLRFAAIAGLTGSLGAAGAVLSLRGMHRGPLASVGLLVAGLLLAPAVIALVPVHPGPAGPLPLAAHLACASGGLVAALISAGAVLVFAREDRPAPWRLLAAGGSGGLFGFLASNAHCPAVHPMHLLLGHATAGLLVGGALVLLAALRR